MRALRYHRYGPPEVLRYDELPVPAPAPGEVVVQVHYASVNPVDWKNVAGKFRFLTRGGLPRCPGSDFSGVVTAVGSGVRRFSAGDRVLGIIDPFKRPMGTFAEYVAVPESHAFAMPASMDFRIGGALPCAGLSAVTLCHEARVGRGSKVLVNGASGGVGHLAVQVAKARGARVTATASARNHDYLRELGADECIDYTKVPPAKWLGGLDAVLDCVPNLPRSMHSKLLVRGGRYSSTLPGPATYLIDPLTNRLAGIHRYALMVQPDEAAMRELLDEVARGRVRCTIEHEFGFDEARAALELSSHGRTRGKIVVRIA
jgi:NADPH:quinone reductase-like Zn-dependent oxidoreductase